MLDVESDPTSSANPGSPRRVSTGRRRCKPSMPVFGVAVHCTGSGIVTKALAHGADPFEYALAYYLRPEAYFAHYLIDFDGTIRKSPTSTSALRIWPDGVGPRRVPLRPLEEKPAKTFVARMDRAVAEPCVAVAPLSRALAEQRLRGDGIARVAGRVRRRTTRAGREVHDRPARRRGGVGGGYRQALGAAGRLAQLWSAGLP